MPPPPHRVGRHSGSPGVKTAQAEQLERGSDVKARSQVSRDVSRKEKATLGGRRNLSPFRGGVC